jgi:hypothetical protein
MEESDIIKVDITLQPVETLNEFARQLKILFYKAQGPDADRIDRQIKAIYAEIDSREPHPALEHHDLHLTSGD